jgi:hypothetical protein
MTFALKAPKPPRLTEKEVTQQICDFLRLRGWKVIRLHVGFWKRTWKRKGVDEPEENKFRIGEPGMVDWIAVHPTMHKTGRPSVIWFELKAPGRKPTETRMVKTESGKWRKRPGQQEYLRALDAQGFCCGWFDSLEGFRKFYGKRFE